MRRVLIAAVLTLSFGCATTYRPKAMGPGMFEFVLTPEGCAQLRGQMRAYRATEKTGEYVSGATALVAGALVLIPALRDETAAQGATALVALAAVGTSVFISSQVTDLEQEIIEGGCR